MKYNRIWNYFDRPVFRRLTARPVIASKHISSTDSQSDQNATKNRWLLNGATIAAVGLASVIVSHKTIEAFNQKNSRSQKFTKEEVAQHDSLEKGVWITYNGNVYDVTDFVKHHPGGSHTIMMGAGGDVTPFWQTYTLHHDYAVQKLLSTYHIGILSDYDSKKANNQPEEGPYACEPERNRLLRVHTQQPFNAETPPIFLTQTRHTPVDIFFVRNHLPVPEVDLKDYTLSICLGTDGSPDEQQILAEFTLDDLKKNFKPHTVESVIQCSGNRRSDLKKIKEIKGLDWSVGAIGNATWTGVRLVDLLDSIGFKADGNIKHVQLEGLDCDMSGQAYAASISSDVALDPSREVILAYEMNGQPLTRDHGFPIRFIAPGVTGARNVKWLSKIILSHEESNGHWQMNDYKSFSPNIDMFSLNYKHSISIQETPVQSAICEPIDGGELLINPETKNPTMPIKGYAYSGGGKMIIRVDVSLDGGETWHTANLMDAPKDQDNILDYSKRNSTYSWTRWSLDVPISENIARNSSGTIEIICRAFDSSYNSQPERPETIWNVRGVVNNSWHKVRLNIKIQ